MHRIITTRRYLVINAVSSTHCFQSHNVEWEVQPSYAASDVFYRPILTRRVMWLTTHLLSFLPRILHGTLREPMLFLQLSLSGSWNT